MNVLVDTSVWVDHFKYLNLLLSDLLLQDFVVIHPYVIGEIACGTPPSPRMKTISDLQLLRGVKQSTYEETVDFIEREKLYGLGCGFIDVGLLASTLITPDTKLWTLDKRLVRLAQRFNVAFAG